MKAVILIFTVLLFTIGCGTLPIPPIVLIAANETAFLVPLEGATSDQGEFMSMDYLNANKIATKRVTIPVKKRKLGRGWINYEWIPTVSVIKVDRTPVTREWTQTDETGTSARNEAITVESSGSIGFAVGLTVTCAIAQTDAAAFLYNFTAGKTLAQVVDENVRGFIQGVLSREFGSRSLSDGRRAKAEIFDIAFAETKAQFEPLGITIMTMGLAEGLTYTNPEIQKGINNVFLAQMSIDQAGREREAQAERNQMDVEIARAKRMAAQEFAKASQAQERQVELEIRRMVAQATLNASERWNGATPSGIVPDGSPFLFNFGTK